MQVSHTKIECFCSCPFQYKLRYLDRVQCFPDDASNNALYLGTALHTCLQDSVEAGIKQFYSFYPVATDAVISEALKLELLASKAKKILPSGGKAEIEVKDSDFIGYIDWLIPKEDGHFDLYDFKYCSKSSEKKYPDSEQLHLYKYFFEKCGLGIIDNLNYLIVPKTGIRQKKTETIEQFRLRIRSECEKIQPYILPIEYDAEKVVKFLTHTKHLLECDDFEKTESSLCAWCEYHDFCKLGETTMILPKPERRVLSGQTSKKVWIYGQPFTGKTRFANEFPVPLMLNTDGNIKFVDAPFIAIKDEVTVEGRLTNRKFAWEVFKESIAELEKKQNDFKTIVVDLLEDTYEMCRVFMYDQLGITHESDDSFRAWDKIRSEWLNTMKRLLSLDYDNIILISHEDSTRDLTKKSGDKISAIKPNLNDKMSNKIAGMVDIVGRVVAEGDNRTLTFKNSETIFGGGRIKVKAMEIPLTYEDFIGVYDEKPVKVIKVSPETVEEPVEEPIETPADEEPKKVRRRRVRTDAE